MKCISPIEGARRGRVELLNGGSTIASVRRCSLAFLRDEASDATCMHESEMSKTNLFQGFLNAML